MAKIKDRAKLQGKRYGIAEKSVDDFARQKSEAFNEKVENQGWSKIYILAALTLLMLIPLAVAVVVYKEGLYNNSPGYEKVNQAIMAPHAEEEMKEKYLESIQDMKESDSLSAVEKRRIQ
jgi:hypothetical protein